MTKKERLEAGTKRGLEHLSKVEKLLSNLDIPQDDSSTTEPFDPVSFSPEHTKKRGNFISKRRKRAHRR